MNYRRREGIYDPDEIARAFPDINRNWVLSDDLEDLRRLPVKKGDLKHVDDSEFDLGKSELSDQAKREILGQIESLLKILKDNL